MPSSQQVALPRRRWLRFSLRTFMLAITVLCILLGMYVKQRRDQQAAIHMLKRWKAVIYLKGAVEYDADVLDSLPRVHPDERRHIVEGKQSFVTLFPSRKRGKDATWISTEFPPPSGSAWARRWFGEYFFAEVSAVSLPYYPREEIDPRIIARLRGLKYLSLSGTRTDDDDLRILARLASLEQLSLADNDVSDDGLRHLLRLSNLKHLVLTRNAVSDRGLVHVRRMKQLEYLSLSGTLVTKAGVGELQNALPKCTIEW